MTSVYLGKFGSCKKSTRAHILRKYSQNDFKKAILLPSTFFSGNRFLGEYKASLQGKVQIKIPGTIKIGLT